jgi:methylmalonyl-CoA/ethylmalonyl-CoA epimerase
LTPATCYRTFFLPTGDVDREGTIDEGGTIHGPCSFLRRLGRTHGDVREAAGAAALRSDGAMGWMFIRIEVKDKDRRDLEEIIGGFGMKIKHIDHIGIAVRSIEQAGKFYTNVLGLKIMDIENVADQKVNVAFLPITDSEVELLQSTHDDGPVAKFIEAKGEGIQHIAYRVENIEEALAELKAKGVRLIDEKPRKGAGGAKIAFIHPKETNGVLVEICERK